MPRGAHLAVQHRFQTLEQVLDAPATPIQLGQFRRLHARGRHIGQQPNHLLAILGGLIQAQFDPPQCMANTVLILNADRLFVDRPGANASDTARA